MSASLPISVMPGLGLGIHERKCASVCRSAWMAGPSPAMTLASYVRDRALFRSSMNTACAPNRFHSHHGALTRTGLP
jgi:hypothetical protein